MKGVIILLVILYILAVSACDKKKCEYVVEGIEGCFDTSGQSCIVNNCSENPGASTVTEENIDTTCDDFDGTVSTGKCVSK